MSYCGNKEFFITTASICKYLHSMRENERAESSISKYRQILNALAEKLNGERVTKERLVQYKQGLLKKYAPTTTNVCICAINGLLRMNGMEKMCLKKLRIEDSPYRLKSAGLSREDYRRLLEAAKGDDCAECLLETLAGLGLRVSEVQFITVKALKKGYVNISNKGKSRNILLPVELRGKLLAYVEEEHIQWGPVFITKRGKAISRQQIWHMLKQLADAAGIDRNRVYPHNLRHLFATVFMKVHRDIDLLSKVMGHSNINTTRIYTKLTQEEMSDMLSELRLIV